MAFAVPWSTAFTPPTTSTLENDFNAVFWSDRWRNRTRILDLLSCMHMNLRIRCPHNSRLSQQLQLIPILKRSDIARKMYLYEWRRIHGSRFAHMYEEYEERYLIRQLIHLPQ